MANSKMVWDDEQGRMISTAQQTMSEAGKVSLDSGLAERLKDFAIEDGFDFSGISYVTVKTADGKTKKTADGKPVFVMENGKPKTVPIAESVAKVNAAISLYVKIAVKKLIAERNEKTS